MFDNFHFGTSVQADAVPSLCELAPHDTSIFSDLPSPTSSVEEAYTPLAMMDILGKLEQQTLECTQQQQGHQRTSYFGALPTPPLDASFAPHPCRESSPPSLPIAHSLRAMPTCRRLQRQLHTRLQISSQHLRSLSALVEDMVETGTQCSLAASSALPVTCESEDVPSSDSVEHDEGYCEGDDDHGGMNLLLRRSSAPSDIRKVGGLSYRSSKDCIRTDVIMTRTLVRMRRRTKPKKRRT